MKLQKLKKESLEAVVGKRICCVERSQSYLEEFITKYDVLEYIEVILDNNVDKQGEMCLQGLNIPVCAIDYLEGVDSKEYVVVITGDYYREHFDYLNSNGELERKFETIYYFANQETEYEEEFRNLYKESTLKNIIIFRSGPHINSYIRGMDFTDNARALFEYMLENGYNKKYKLVWMVKEPREFEKYLCHENVCFLPLEWSVSPDWNERKQYYEVLCLAKFIFFTDAYGIARNARSDQVRVQLWHGCGFKTRLNFQSCEKRYEFMAVSSDLYAMIHSKIFGLRRDQLLVTGYPKQDWLMKKEHRDYREILGLTHAQKYIFWLPTYRQANDVLNQKNGYTLDSELGLPIVNTIEEMRMLNTILQKVKVVLVIKLHPYQKKEMIRDLCFSNIVFVDNEQLYRNDIQINQLLSMADALISDYSSVAVDFLLLNRPMAFMLQDLSFYEERRGFIFDNVCEYLPGKEIYSVEDVCLFIEEISHGIDTSKSKREKLKWILNNYYDGNCSKRIIDYLGI